MQQRAITAETDDEVNLIGEVIGARSERHQPLLDRREVSVLGQQPVVQNCCFHEYNHALVLEKIITGW